jgi:putative ABC transport system substrate-binding protein
VALCSFLLDAAVLQAAEIEAPKAAVIVSRNIRPYMEAVEGISAVLSETAGARIQVFSLEKFQGKSQDVLVRQLTGEKFDLFVAVGPEAVRFVREKPVPVPPPWLYSMILNAPVVSGPAGPVCGVPLDIPVQLQLEMIAQGLSSKRLGLLYDPRYNSEVFMRAAAQAPSLDLKILPLEVSSKKDIPVVLKQNLENIDALWLVPDQTVISESIVAYIIKDALLRNIPVIGYNRFFYESGAAMAFVFNYEELGRQTGRLAANLLREKACGKETPVFRVWLNLRVMQKLGIAVPERKSPLMEVRP